MSRQEGADSETSLRVNGMGVKNSKHASSTTKNASAEKEKEADVQIGNNMIEQLWDDDIWSNPEWLEELDKSTQGKSNTSTETALHIPQTSIVLQLSLAN